MSFQHGTQSTSPKLRAGTYGPAARLCAGTTACSASCVNPYGYLNSCQWYITNTGACQGIPNNDPQHTGCDPVAVLRIGT